jgi:hypothetical protein
MIGPIVVGNVGIRSVSNPGLSADYPTRRRGGIGPLQTHIRSEYVSVPLRF